MGKQINVTVAGCGTVGSGVVEMLTNNCLSHATDNDVRLKYIVDIKNIETPPSVTLTSDFDAAIIDTDILCETIGGTGIAYKYTKKALENGVSVVTSNKALVAAHGDELRRIARENGVWYLYEASVCGGVPVLRPLKTCLAGNRITGLDGIVNGSTNYLITRMSEDGVSFPAALGEAKKLGFVEANPDDDLLGFDARRKLAILASSAFFSKLSDDSLIPTTGITRLTMEDVTLFKSIGYAVKLIAHAQLVENGWTGWIHPSLVSSNSPLYGVNDVFNGLIITGDYVDKVMFYGRGAGMKPTASAIIGDITEISRSIDRPYSIDCSNIEAPEFVNPGNLNARIAFRTNADVSPKGMSIEKKIKANDQFLVFTKEQPLNELLDNPIFKTDGVGIPLILA